MLMVLNILLVLSGIAALITFIMVLIEAFKRSVLWGLGVLFVPFVIFFFAYKFWPEVKKPFLAYMGATVINIVIVTMVFFSMGGMMMLDMAESINDGSLTEQQAAEFMVETMKTQEQMGGPSKDQMLNEIRQDPNINEEQAQQAEQLMRAMDLLAQGKAATLEEAMEMAAEESGAKIEPSQTAKGPVTPAEVTSPPPSAVQTTPVVQAPPAAQAAPAIPDRPQPKIPAAPLPAEIAKVMIKPSDAGNYIGKFLQLTTIDGRQREGTLVAVDGKTLEFELREFSGYMSYKTTMEKIDTLEVLPPGSQKKFSKK